MAIRLRSATVETCRVGQMSRILDKMVPNRTSRSVPSGTGAAWTQNETPRMARTRRRFKDGMMDVLKRVTLCNVEGVVC